MHLTLKPGLLWKQLNKACSTLMSDSISLLDQNQNNVTNTIGFFKGEPKYKPVSCTKGSAYLLLLQALNVCYKKFLQIATLFPE